MADEFRFILGRGEQLTSTISVPRGGGPKNHPYSFSESRQALLPLFQKAGQAVSQLSPGACPGDHAVAALTLHPAYLAKSYFPTTLLKQAELTSIGSKAKRVVPRSAASKDALADKTKSRESGNTPAAGQSTVQFFVAGPRKNIESLPAQLANARAGTTLASDIIKIEDFYVPEPQDRVRLAPDAGEELLLEIVLHTSRSPKLRQLVFDGFEAYSERLALRPDFDGRFEADGLCFLAMRTPKAQVEEVAEFTFLRAVREMPRLRQFRPFFPRNLPGMEAFPVELPKQDAINPAVRVAVFDGGLPKDHGLGRWVTALDAGTLSDPVPEYQNHGMAVTSALLFGPLSDDEPASTPPTSIDHYRVLDSDTANDTQGELYDVLHRIDGVLSKNAYPFVSLSIGPDFPIEDDDPSAWTTILDKHFGEGTTLASVAVGNRGDEDRATGYHRIQPPSDCVNALAVGAADSVSANWKRAPYSCMGPGRCPGFVKPDVVAFGGSRKEPFWALYGTGTHASPITGTSFAAPTTIRLGASTRAHFGDGISALATKALLVHGADPSDHDRSEVGWGRVPTDVLSLMACDKDEVRIIYQDVLSPTLWLRAPVPVPEQLDGMVTISATLCFATETDPQDSLSYTRSGLEVVFRPHDGRRKRGTSQVHADPRSFFSSRLFGETEQELRGDSHKWETTLHHAETMRSVSLSDPVFDIHYVPREEGRTTSAATKIPYALVVSVRAPKVKDIFERTLARYPILQQIRPVIEIPIRA